ncbi:MAG: TetR/AcrR family transcriptional regulator [Myxococcota bacterium]
MANTKETIQDIATDLVQRTGLNSFSFRTLADQVGVKSSSVHYHFPSKGDLVRALIQTYTAHFRDKLDEITAQRSTLYDRLQGLIDIFEAVLLEEKLCLCGALAAQVGALDEDSQALLRRYFSVAESWLVYALRAHADQLQTPMSPEDLAQVLMAGLEGAVLIDRVDGGQRRLDAMRAMVRAVTAS